ncbi:hypothetical protein DFJ73DRAFT_66037 [Zopfochytrium polystomum]|nr:hypothetical protein DFJ73DRAFT_66037 [Zopfochytrium polystomum]
MDSMMSGTSTLGRPQSESIFSSAQSSRTPSQVEATFSADSLLGTGGGGVDFLTPKKPQTQKVSPSGTDESFAANQVPQLVSSGSGGSSGSSGGSGFGIVRNVGSYVPTLTQEGFPGPDSSKSNAVTFNFQQHPQVVPKQPAPPQQLLQRPPLAQPPTAARNLALTGGVLRPYLHPLAESSGPVQERPSAVSPPSIKPSPLSKIGDNLLDPNRAASALSNPKRWSGDSFFSSDTNPLERRFSTMTASTVGIGMDKLWRDAPRGATISSRKEKDDDDEGGVEGLDGGAMEKMWGTPSPAPTPAVSSFEADDQSNRAATESVPSSTASLSADTLPKVSRISTSLMDEMMGAILQVAESVNEKSKTESAGRSGSTQSGSTQGGSTQIRDLVITAPERKSSADNGVRMTMPQPLPIAPDKVRSESPTAADLPANAKGSGGPSPPAQPNAAESDSSLREKQQRMEMFLSGRMPHVQQRGESLAMGKILEGLTGQPQRRATPIPGSAAQEGSKSADQYGTSPSQMEKNWNPIPQPFVDQPKQPQPSPPIASSFGPPSGPSTHFGQPQPVLPPGYPFPQPQPHQQQQQSYAIVNTSAHDADNDGNESDDLDESTVPPWLLPALRRDREEKYQQAARAAVERARAPPPSRTNLSNRWSRRNAANAAPALLPATVSTLCPRSIVCDGAAVPRASWRCADAAAAAAAACTAAAQHPRRH